MEKFLENLQEAETTLRTADHMFYVTFPLLKDKKLLLKILQDTKTAISKCISSILQQDYLYKRISLYNNQKANFRTFESKSSKRYNITEQEIRDIKDLFDISESLKQSSMEFLKNDKIVILSRDMQPKTITTEKIKEFLTLTKNILRKTQNAIHG